MTTNVLNLPGDYRIRVASGGGTVTIDANLLDVYGNTILGQSAGNTIDANAEFISGLIPRDPATYDLGSISNHWKTLNVEQITQWGTSTSTLNVFYNKENVGNMYPPYPGSLMGRPYDPLDKYGGVDGETHRKAGAVYIAGGVGIEKDLNVGGFIYGRIEIATTSLSVLVTATNANYEFNPLFSIGIGEQLVELDNTGILNGLTYNPAIGRISTDRIRVGEVDNATSPTTGALIVAGGVGVGVDVYVGKNVTVDGTDESTTPTTGALKVAGGVGVGKSLYVNKDVTAENVQPKSDASGHIGDNSTQWASAYVHDLYTRIISSTEGPIQVKPESRMTDIYGDIRVRGTNPIGTAPVVTNVLYVTMDGDDTNDGRAQDAGRACRTVGGAMNSPYYQPGTQILVSAGHYLEDNPLIMKPYTSVRGSDIRTTFIEPINKTQDLWHMNSGCYLNYMNFLNGRSGLLAGEYTLGYNRGAYCTCFPPQTGDARIDVFQSPYVQNCTNQSGPWLKDGTMFVPDQTVQVPLAVGMGSWEASTASIVVNVSTGTISIGQSINPGQQNPGFFNARTLLLANKSFLQSQVVAFLDTTFNSGAFTYNAMLCSRDTELVVDAIATDLLYDSNSDSTFAGIQYWSHSALTGNIPAELTATIAATVFLKSLALSYVTDPGNYSTVGTLFDTITSILSTSATNITDSISYGGLPSTYPATLADVAALQANRATMQVDVIDYVDSTFPAMTYNTATCFRDVGYIIDSVCFDVLHGGNVQSIKSGVYYWGYSTTSVLPVTTSTNEIPATTAAYNFIKSIIPNIVTGQQLLSTYQTGTVQVIAGYDPGSTHEVTALRNKIDVITDIIRNGPDVAEAKTPIALIENTATSVLNSYNILIANIPFIKSEVLAFIDATMNTFTYNRQKSYRDTGILIENMAYDMAFGGNEKSVESDAGHAGAYRAGHHRRGRDGDFCRLARARAAGCSHSLHGCLGNKGRTARHCARRRGQWLCLFSARPLLSRGPRPASIHGRAGPHALPAVTDTR